MAAVQGSADRDGVPSPFVCQEANALGQNPLDVARRRWNPLRTSGWSGGGETESRTGVCFLELLPHSCPAFPLSFDPL